MFFLNFSFSQNSNLFNKADYNMFEKEIMANSLNFIWVYSANSCSFKDQANLFEDVNVKHFFSANFQNFSISIDTLEIINYEKIKIEKSGYYFIDSSFSIVHKHLKNPKTPYELIQIGKVALDSSRRYQKIIQHYLVSDNKNIDFLLQYLKTRKNAKEIASKDIDEFVSLIDSSNYNSPATIEFLYDYFFCRTYDVGYYYFDVRSKAFEILLNNRDLIVEVYDTTQIDLRINALLNFGLSELINYMNLKVIEKSASFLNDTIPTCKLNDTDGNLLLYLKGNKNDTIDKVQALRAFYFLNMGDTSNYLLNESKYLKLSNNNPVGLFFMANFYFRNINDKYFINKAETITRQAYELDENNYGIVGLMAEILYKKNKYNESMIFIEKAIKLYIENGIQPSQFEIMKDNIIKRIKIY